VRLRPFPTSCSRCPSVSCAFREGSVPCSRTDTKEVIRRGRVLLVASRRLLKEGAILYRAHGPDEK
jgi:hypothetical protein